MKYKYELITDSEREHSFNEFKRKRKRTLIVFAFQYFMIGAETSANVTSLWIYVTRDMDTNKPSLFYGLINASVYIPAMLFCAAIGRTADSTRRIKLSLIIVNYISIVGCIFYIIPTSPYWAVTGQALQGFTILLKPLMASEIVRSYHSRELQCKLPILSSAEQLGFAVTPALMTLFVKTDFWIGNIHITYGNVSGIILLAFNVAIQVTVIFMAYDLSREFDVKQHEENMIVIGDTSEENSRSIKEILKNIFTRIDPIFVMLFSFYVSFFDISTFRILPMLILQNLGYNTNTINVCFVISSFTSMTLIAIIICFNANSRQVYWCGFVSLVTVLFIAGFYVVYTLDINDARVTIPMLIINSVMFALVMLGENVFAQVMCGQLTRSKNQSFVEGIRIFIQTSGKLSGALIIVYAYNNLVYFATFTSCVAIILTSILLVRKNALMYPKSMI